jgi:hypothetical protein
LITKPPVEVQKSKEEFVKTYEKSLKTCFGSSPVPPALLHYFKYLTSMNHDTKPDFSKLRGIFEAGIKDAGGKNSGKLEFGTPSRPATPKVAPAKRTRGEPKKYTEVDSDGEEAVSKKKAPKKKAAIVESEPELLDESEEEIIPASTKRNRDKKRKEESDEDEILEISPKKKSRNAPADKPSKEKSRVSPDGSVSPPSKKEKSSKGDSQSSVVTLKSKSKSSKPKKTIHLNFNLDVSLNSDVVIVLNLKEKKNKTEEEEDKPNTDENEPAKENRAGFYKGKQAKTK